MTSACLEAAARAIQMIYLESGRPCDFSDGEIAEDFTVNRALYTAMVRAARAVFEEGQARGRA